MSDIRIISDIRHKFLRIQQYGHYTRLNSMVQKYEYRLMLYR